MEALKLASVPVLVAVDDEFELELELELDEAALRLDDGACACPTTSGIGALFSSSGADKLFSIDLQYTLARGVPATQQ